MVESKGRVGGEMEKRSEVERTQSYSYFLGSVSQEDDFFMITHEAILAVEISHIFNRLCKVCADLSSCLEGKKDPTSSHPDLLMQNHPSAW